jgi:hypothetical protein
LLFEGCQIPVVRADEVCLNRLSAVGLCLLIALAPTCAPRKPSVRDIPAAAQEAALAEFEAEYGTVDEIYASGETTMGPWRSMEPNNTSSFPIPPYEETDPIYALFVWGSFEVVGPASRDPPASPESGTFEGGRIVFDASGVILNIALWLEDTNIQAFATGDPPFGANFDT